MEYLYAREKELKKQIRELEKMCFNPLVKPKLADLRARYDEVFKAIRVLEHEI